MDVDTIASFVIQSGQVSEGGAITVSCRVNWREFSLKSAEEYIFVCQKIHFNCLQYNNNEYLYI